MLATDGGYEYEGSFNKLANEVDPSYFFEDFQDIFANDDWTIANLENVFTDDPNIQRKGKNHSPAYWYKSKTANTDILNAGSIEVVSLANNHSGDYGTKGNQDTKDALDKAGVIWGDDDKIVTLEKEGFRIAIYCCTFYYGGYEKIIMDNLMAVDADYRIVYFHGGTERVHVPDGWKAAGARRMIDNGADLVIGGHPHVLQPIEEYNGKKILHSMGDFLLRRLKERGKPHDSLPPVADRDRWRADRDARRGGSVLPLQHPLQADAHNRQEGLRRRDGVPERRD